MEYRSSGSHTRAEHQGVATFNPTNEFFQPIHCLRLLGP
jgi:hypothetical protein